MKILLGITSGISIYKSLNVIRMLVKAGHSIRVIMTPNAAELINPLLYKTLSLNEVYVKDFDIKEPLAHIRLGDWADILVVLPATANTIAKISSGIADNLLTSTILAFNGKKFIFPAMNVKMYENPATQENINKLRDNKFVVIEPFCGDLACGYKGKGRLPPEDYIFGWIDRDVDEPLKGMSFIVSAGGTIEKIDPVRFISNFSSGRMGFETAKALFRKGAKVLLVYGNVSVPVPSYIPAIQIQSAEDLLKALKNNLSSYDGLYMAAAPADFKAGAESDTKIKKMDALSLSLIKTPDILKELTKEFNDKLFVGFALETDNYLQNAGIKLKEKGVDYIVLNTITKDFNPLGSEFNSVALISKDSSVKEMKKKTKREIAEWLVEETLSGVK